MVATSLFSRSFLPIHLRKPLTRLLLFLVCLRTTAAGGVEAGSAGIVDGVADVAVGATRTLDLFVGLPGTPLILEEATRFPLAVTVC